MVVLATLATVIASQAVITGTYFMTRGVMRLDFLPPMPVVHTSSRIAGQVFMPWINTMLLGLVLVAVLGFRSSTNLGAAYGIAVTGTMLVTTLLLLVIARHRWHWRIAAVCLLGVPLLLIDGAFLGANLLKVVHGGWFPLVLGALAFVVMTTWHRGRQLQRLQGQLPELACWVARATARPTHHTPATAVFLSSEPGVAPPALQLGLQHFGTLHTCNVIVHVQTLETPFASAADAADWQVLGRGFYAVTLRFGFMQAPDVPKALAACPPPPADPQPDLAHANFFLPGDTKVVARQIGMNTWRGHLFAFLARNTPSSVARFHLPADRVVELGSPAEI